MTTNYTEVADYYKGNPEGGYKSFVFTDYLSAEELVSLRDFLERDVRAQLGIPFNPSMPSIRFEHSMGQMGGRLPPNILRTTHKQTAAARHIPSLAGLEACGSVPGLRGRLGER